MARVNKTYVRLVAQALFEADPYMGRDRVSLCAAKAIRWAYSSTQYVRTMEFRVAVCDFYEALSFMGKKP